jgi:predicted phage terminase large subunit-like protein
MRRLSADYLRSLPREQVEAAVRQMTPSEAEALRWEWSFWARDSQLEPPGDWFIWLLRSGRGFGKTRTASEAVRKWAVSGKYRQILIAGRTASDVRSQQIEGPGGLLSVHAPWERPKYEPSKRQIVWPNGTIGIIRYGAEPDSFRGFEGGAAALDEVFHWANPQLAWETLIFGMREASADMRILVTSTPLTTEFCRDFMKQPGLVMTTGSTFENSANLNPKALAAYRARYDGTRMGRQELYGELLEDNPGALWRHEWISKHRVDKVPCALKRIVVAVDPAASYGEKSDETGIVVAGLGVDGRGYVLADYSLRAHPDEWARKVVWAYRKHNANLVVAEKNNGGNMVEHTLRMVEKGLPLKCIHAKQGKRVRGEPVSTLYEQGLVAHAGGESKGQQDRHPLYELELQMTAVEPGGDEHDDRIDAVVYAITELLVEKKSDLSGYARAWAS